MSAAWASQIGFTDPPAACSRPRGAEAGAGGAASSHGGLASPGQAARDGAGKKQDQELLLGKQRSPLTWGGEEFASLLSLPG